MPSTRDSDWTGVLILAYHDVHLAGSPSDCEPWNTTSDRLTQHVTELMKTCDVVSLADAEALAYERGRRVALTFDDGHVSHYSTVFPLLLDQGITATFFLPTGIIDSQVVMLWHQLVWLCGGRRGCVDPTADARTVLSRTWHLHDSAVDDLIHWVASQSDRLPLRAEDEANRWITWDMARSMAAAGMTVGAHTVSHRVLRSLHEHDQHREIAGSVDRVEHEIGRRPKWLAYPIGAPWSFDRRTRAIIRSLGLIGLSGYGEVCPHSTWDPTDVRRVPVTSSTKTLTRLLTDPAQAARSVGAGAMRY